MNVNKHDGINTLNNKLLAAGVYTAVVQKRVDYWREMRNKAAHGLFADYTESNVREMIQGAQELLAEPPS